jgi:hypothetical protein
LFTLVIPRTLWVLRCLADQIGSTEPSGLNTADEITLMQVPGLGPTKARRIREIVT